MIVTTSHVTSVKRAIAILELLDRSHRGLSMSEIGRKINIPKSTAHVIVRTLEHAGYVVRHVPGCRYTLSFKAYSLGREMIRQGALSKIALPPMKWLVGQTRLTVHLAVYEKNQAMYVQKVNGLSLIRFDTFIGKRTNLHCTGVGKVLLAYAPELLRHQFLSKATFAKYTPKTITSAATLRKALDKIRKQGYAIDDQEEEIEVRCIAVPVFNDGNEFVAALGVTGTVGQITAENCPMLVSLTKRAAARIGCPLPTPSSDD